MFLGKPEESPETKTAASGYVELYLPTTTISLFSLLFIYLFWMYHSFKALIKEVDANKDGRVSRDELLAGVEKFFVGKTAATLPGFSFSNITSYLY